MMIQDPHTHLLMHRLSVEEREARRHHHHLPRRRGVVQWLRSSLLRRRAPQTTPTPVRSVTIAVDGAPCGDAAASTPRAA